MATLAAQGGGAQLPFPVPAVGAADNDTAVPERWIVSDYEKLVKNLDSKRAEAYREKLYGLLQRRMFFLPSYKIYGSVSGLFDFGPPGCAVKSNIQNTWKAHFVLEESMLEVECPAVTPHPVLKASGHVDRFTDFMVLDAVTGEPHRADHMLEKYLESIINGDGTADAKQEAQQELSRVGEMTQEDLGAALTKYGIKSPDTGNDISAPFPFNLMFATSIGPKGDMPGYLRPETAQGIFVNFRDLLFYNGGKLPFAVAQIGNSYRNEISPRAGLIRVREFTQAEIEHFVHPDKKDHPKFGAVADLAPLLFSRELQLSESPKPEAISLGHAVSSGMIANQTLGYFIGRTYLFLQRLGMHMEHVRFRQHLASEMAHYAEDCWDAEVRCSYGWIECVGLADRSAFDLKAHTAASKTELTAYETFPEPRMEEVVEVKPNNKVLGQTFKGDSKSVQSALLELSDAAALQLQTSLEQAGESELKTCDKTFTIKPDMVTIAKTTKRLTGRAYTPSVIEPSFGIGRIMYCMMEHCYYTREGAEDRAVFGFLPSVAPIKACVFPLLQRDNLNEVAQRLSTALTRAGLRNIIDVTGATIGKRYARTDEIGVPFAITVDMTSIEDSTVTVRERDTTAQIRVPEAEVVAVLSALVAQQVRWDVVRGHYPTQGGENES